MQLRKWFFKPVSVSQIIKKYVNKQFNKEKQLVIYKTKNDQSIKRKE